MLAPHWFDLLAWNPEHGAGQSRCKADRQPCLATGESHGSNRKHLSRDPSPSAWAYGRQTKSGYTG
jgi:hypothetical protein